MDDPRIPAQLRTQQLAFFTAPVRGGKTADEGTPHGRPRDPCTRAHMEQRAATTSGHARTPSAPVVPGRNHGGESHAGSHLLMAQNRGPRARGGSPTQRGCRRVSREGGLGRSRQPGRSGATWATCAPMSRPVAAPGWLAAVSPPRGHSARLTPGGAYPSQPRPFSPHSRRVPIGAAAKPRHAAGWPAVPDRDRGDSP